MFWYFLNSVYFINFLLINFGKFVYFVTHYTKFSIFSNNFKNFLKVFVEQMFAEWQTALNRNWSKAEGGPKSKWMDAPRTPRNR